MFDTKETYRPKHIEFNVTSDLEIIPESLGTYETPEEAAKFIGGNFTAINQSLTVGRHMDNYEKETIRKKYDEILEDHLPRYESQLSEATRKLEEAKKAAAEAKERVNAAITEVKGLARQAKRGIVDMDLDELYTSRIPVQGRYYYYTYIDGELRLCKACDIPERETGDLYNAMASNEEFFDNNFGDSSLTDVDFEDDTPET